MISTSKVTTPQDAHRRLVLQVYLGSNTLEFSAIRRLNLMISNSAVMRVLTGNRKVFPSGFSIDHI